MPRLAYSRLLCVEGTHQYLNSVILSRPKDGEGSQIEPNLPNPNNIVTIHTSNPRRYQSRSTNQHRTPAKHLSNPHPPADRPHPPPKHPSPDAAVPDRPNQLPLNPTRRRRLAPSRIRPRQNRMLPPSHPQRLPRRTSRHKHRHHRNQNPRQPRRNKIHHIVQSCPAPPKSQIPRRLIPHHRIHRAHNLKQHQPGQPAHDIPRNRTRKSIRQIFAQTLNRRPSARRNIHPIVSRPTSRAIATRAPPKSPARAALSTAHECFSKSRNAKHE